MTILEELKNKWEEGQKTLIPPPGYDQASLEKIIKARVKKPTNMAMRYFWASFTLQLIVYALLSHVIVKYWSDPEILRFSLVGILLYLPFTVMLMRKFKSIAKTRPTDSTGTSLYQYVSRRYTLLDSFYRFKKRYELMLIPLSAVIGVFLVFKLYVPGGVAAHPWGAGITLVITLISCLLALRSENRKNFEQPLHQLQEILNEFKSEAQ